MLIAPKANQGNRLTLRSLVGFAVLSTFLGIAVYLTNQGRLMLAWVAGSAGFALGAIIAGSELDPDE
jgi:hypothetical protein